MLIDQDDREDDRYDRLVVRVEVSDYSESVWCSGTTEYGGTINAYSLKPKSANVDVDFLIFCAGIVDPIPVNVVATFSTSTPPYKSTSTTSEIVEPDGVRLIHHITYQGAQYDAGTVEIGVDLIDSIPPFTSAEVSTMSQFTLYPRGNPVP